MHVVIDGPTLSLLLYSHYNSKGKENGFLLGHKMEKVQNTVTDSQMLTEKVHTYIYINSFIPWPRHKCLHGRNGRVDESLMQDVLQNTDQNVIGWYSFRHQSSRSVSMKEASIHNQLIASVAEYQGEAKDDFLFFLCTSLATRNLSTHSIDYAFMLHKDNRFESIPMEVKNLGDTSKTDYVSESASPTTSKVIKSNMGSAGKNFLNSSGQLKQVVDVKSFVSSMAKGLESAQTKVNNSEAVLHLLETEVMLLRKRAALMEQEEMQRVFREAEIEKEKQKEEEKRRIKEQDAEEEMQMNKLLLDLGLGLATPISNGSSNYNSRGPSPIPPAVSMPILEAGVNPLYVSTLTDDSVVDTFEQFQLPNGSQFEDENNSKRTENRIVGKVQLSNSGVETNCSGRSNMVTSSESDMQFDSHLSKISSRLEGVVDKKSKDPFAFVTDEVKSELKLKQVRHTRSAVQKNIDPNTNVDKNLCSSSKVFNSNDMTGALNFNGHDVDKIHNDEHDGPSPSNNHDLTASSSGITNNNNNVSLSSSPVF